MMATKAMAVIVAEVAVTNSTLAGLPALGVGLGFREPFLSDLFLRRSEVDFLEITVDHYFNPSPAKRKELDLLAEHFPLIPHGLSLSVGSAEGLDPDYLRQFAEIVRRVKPPWWSEHIAFTHAGGVEVGHLAPVPFTREGVDVVVRNVAEARRQIEVPFLLENISYLVALPGGEMTEAQFLTEVLERTDCGMLLDVTNVYMNSVNHGYNAVEFLQQIPLERVVQLHFVGGHQHGNILIDSHSQPTPPEIWELMEVVLARAPVKGVILERDENIPPFEELLSELRQARTLGRQHGRWA